MNDFWKELWLLGRVESLKMEESEINVEELNSSAAITNPLSVFNVR